MALLELQLREFLDELTSDAATPGGGSVAAVVTAASAGLLVKVARASKGSWPAAAGVAAQAEALRDRAAPLAQIDAEEYEAALRVRESDEEAGDRRDYTVGRAYARAASPPVRIVEAAADVAELAELVAANCDPAFRADAVTAALLAAACAAAGAELVAVNLTVSAGDERVVRTAALAEGAARAAEAAQAARE
jgi:formiminotetrahydrofolate cyclodeaminase